MSSRIVRCRAVRAFPPAAVLAALSFAMGALAAPAAAVRPAVAAAPAVSAAPAMATAANAPARPAPPSLDTAPYSFRTVEGAGGVPLNVVAVGDPKNPPILLIHGLAQSWVSFQRQFESELAKKYYLVAFDLRGHGGSGKPWDRAAYQSRELFGEDAARVVKAMGLVRPLVVGWSYGTIVAMDYARYAGPAAIAGIEFVGAYGGLTPPPDMSAPASPAAAAAASTFMTNRLKQASPDFRYNYEATRSTVRALTAEPMSPEWTERAVTISMMMPRVAREGMFMRSLEARDLLPVLKGTPFLINVGAKDTSTPEAAGRELAKQLADATVSVYPEAGHSPFVESTERFNRELDAFATRVFAASAGR